MRVTHFLGFSRISHKIFTDISRGFSRILWEFSWISHRILTDISWDSHGNLMGFSRIPHGILTDISRDSHGYLTRFSQIIIYLTRFSRISHKIIISHRIFTDISRGFSRIFHGNSHGYLTGLSRISHGILTDILRYSHGYLTGILTDISWEFSRISHEILKDISRNKVHQKEKISRIPWYSDWLHNTTSTGNSILVTNHNTTSCGRSIMQPIRLQCEKWYKEVYVLMNLILTYIRGNLVSSKFKFQTITTTRKKIFVVVYEGAIFLSPYCYLSKDAWTINIFFVANSIEILSSTIEIAISWRLRHLVNSSEMTIAIIIISL